MNSENYEICSLGGTTRWVIVKKGTSLLATLRVFSSLGEAQKHLKELEAD